MALRADTTRIRCDAATLSLRVCGCWSDRAPSKFHCHTPAHPYRGSHTERHNHRQLGVYAAAGVVKRHILASIRRSAMQPYTIHIRCTVSATAPSRVRPDVCIPERRCLRYTRQGTWQHCLEADFTRYIRPTHVCSARQLNGSH